MQQLVRREPWAAARTQPLNMFVNLKDNFFN